MDDRRYDSDELEAGSEFGGANLGPHPYRNDLTASETLRALCQGYDVDTDEQAPPAHGAR